MVASKEHRRVAWGLSHTCPSASVVREKKPLDHNHHHMTLGKSNKASHLNSK